MKVKISIDIEDNIKENEVEFLASKSELINTLITKILPSWDQEIIIENKKIYYQISGPNSVAIFAIIATIIEETSRKFFGSEFYADYVDFISLQNKK
ncbi:MAG: hypothetical protein ACFE85_15245 [Candidatus Hodarchaeota archaeon]